MIKMRVCVLASGSKGNCTYLEVDEYKILIDVGISYKQIRLKLNQIGVKVEEINAVFITHEHLDHVCGLRTFCNNIFPTFYLSEGTFNGLKTEVQELFKHKNYQIIKSKDVINLPNIIVQAISIHHDAREPLGYIMNTNNTKLVYVTDTGYIDENSHHLLVNADIYILESNYDPEILTSSNRPFHLKQRILGDKGHLSNEDSAITLAKIIGKKTKYIVHAHRSQECNMRELVTMTHKRIFKEYEVDDSNIEYHHGEADFKTEVFIL